MRSRKQTKYSFEKKLSVAELYLSSEISYQDLAIQEGITNPSMIANWVNINKKKVQSIIQKLRLQVTSFTEKVANIDLIKVKLVLLHLIE